MPELVPSQFPIMGIFFTEQRIYTPKQLCVSCKPSKLNQLSDSPEMSTRGSSYVVQLRAGLQGVQQKRGQNGAALYIHSTWAHRWTQLYHTIMQQQLLAGCNIILIVFHKQLQAPINYFVLSSLGPQTRKMLCAVDPANLLCVETPGHFGYSAVGPRIHLCVLSSLGQCVHILNGLKITVPVQKLLNAV